MKEIVHVYSINLILWKTSLLYLQITQTSRILLSKVSGKSRPRVSWRKWPATRPTRPDTTLRYSGAKDNGDTSGSIREAPLGSVSGSLVVSDTPVDLTSVTWSPLLHCQVMGQGQKS